MKVLHFVIGRLNPEAINGVNKVVIGLTKYCRRAHIDVDVIGIKKNIPEKKYIYEYNDFNVVTFNSFWKNLKEIKQIVGEYDIVHFHCVWNMYNIILGNHLKKRNKSYVVTVHAGLEHDRIKQSNYLLKILFHKFFQKKYFDNASSIHALTKEEMSTISRYTINKNIFCISNGLDMEKVKLESKSNFRKNNLHVGYLGRFSPEKNIIGLIEAIDLLPNEIKKSIKCSLVGPINSYSKTLKKIIQEKKLEKIIIFEGPLYDENKNIFLKDLDFYIHPVLSDVVSLAVMETMSLGLPAVITRTSQVCYYEHYNSFVMVEPIPIDIMHGILKMITNIDLVQMSKNAITMAVNEFDWKITSTKMISQYRELLS